MPAALVDKLRGIVGSPHVLTGVELAPYVVEGRTPEVAVFPGSVEDVCAIMTLAADAEIPVTPWGGGTAGSVGTPAARAGIILGSRRLDRLLEHEPGDLTATVQAGMTLASFGAALRARGQWLSLDPPDPERATIGGILAANASGPRRHLYGTARDLLIGVTVVTAAGAVVRGGGKVVKNVAGYDVPKLFVGSYGTLGVIVEATLKLRPVPDDERLVCARFERLKDAGAAVRAIMGSDLIPTAIELLDADASRTLGLDGAGTTLVAAFDGLAEQVEWQCSEFGQVTAPFGGKETRTLGPEVWSRLATAAPRAFGTLAATLRFAVLPTQVADMMEQGAGVARARGLLTAWSAHAGVGIVSGALFSDQDQPDLAPIAAVLGEWRDIARASGGHAVLDWAPLALKSYIPVWDDPGAAGRIMQRIKAQLDPKNILNPGRFVGGI